MNLWVITFYNTSLIVLLSYEGSLLIFGISLTKCEINVLFPKVTAEAFLFSHLPRALQFLTSLVDVLHGKGSIRSNGSDVTS